jgi:phosphatidyl-myo-inositol alpha-mannosyltransferase
VRIALVSPYSLEVHGGVQNQVRGLANALSPTEDVTVIAPGGSIELDGAQSVGVGRVSSVPANGSRAPIALDPRSWFATREILRGLNPDVVHVHEPFVPMVGLATSRSHIAPMVATFHRGGTGRMYPLLAPLLRGDFEKIKERVAVSEEALETLRKVFGSVAASVAVIPNAIDLERFSHASKNGSSGQPVVVFVGRHETRKGLSVLLEAFGTGVGNARLEVIGDGPEHKKLLQRFSRPGVVDFLGAIDDQALADHVAGAQVFVAPSLSGESFGVVLLEAMAARTAVIASALPGYQLAAGDAAEFVPPGDAASLRKSLMALLESPDRREALVAKGMNRASHHSFSALAARYLAIYRSLLGV